MVSTSETPVHISVADEVTEWRDIPVEGAVRTDCCHCLVPAAEARFRKLGHFGGYMVSQEVHCKEGCGCYANPRKRIGMWNRPAPEWED